jgi:phosphoglycerate dehydrogenase-like enzyme
MHRITRGIAACLLALPLPAALARPGTPAQPAGAEAIGSTRNGRIAYPTRPGEKVELTFVAGDLPAPVRTDLANAAPAVRIVYAATREEAMAHAAEAHGVDGRFATPEFLAAAPKLVWVQAMSAGVDQYQRIKPLMDNDAIVLTNMRAVHGPAIADHAMAMLLSLTRNLPFYGRAQAAGHWTEEEPPAPSVALEGKTMLVVGLGGIGSEVARRAHGFGMRIIATRRTDTPAPDFVQRVGKPADLLAMLPEADVVAVCVPLTEETRGLFNGRTLAAMKPGSYLINIARGGIVETDALVEALRSGTLAGACLDVTDPEPLPAGHPLWAMKNVILTPHAASDAELTEERRWTLLRENLRRFGAGEPLLNVVDKKAGY